MVRERALELSTPFSLTKAETLALSGLQDRDAWIRRSAIAVLHQLATKKKLPNSKAVVPYLMNALSDTDYSIPYLAVHILAEITGNHWELLKRMPMSEQGRGRDHNPHGFCVWLAGAGIKGGTIHGATDAVGLRAEVDRVHVHDLHATILHLLGIDHTRLTFSHNGRDDRLTETSGTVVQSILS